MHARGRRRRSQDATGDGAPTPLAAPRPRFGLEVLREYVVYLAFFVVLLFFSAVLWNDGFLTIANFMNIIRQTAPITIMAIGMVFAMSAGEIDLSIGSVVALAALVAALLLRVDAGLVVAVTGALTIGLAVGLTNGLLTVGLRIPSFLVTLGMLGVVGGLARTVSGVQAIPVIDETFTFLFGGGSIGPISTLFVWSVVALAVGHWALHHTAFGAHILATGGNRRAAASVGIRTGRLRVAALVTSATMAALAGLLYAGRLRGARYTLGEADLLTVIAAVIIGGTSLFGGKGSVLGALVGSVIMGMLNNGLILMGLSVSGQMIARGVIIVVAVALSLRETEA